MERGGPRVGKKSLLNENVLKGEGKGTGKEVQS